MVAYVSKLVVNDINNQNEIELILQDIIEVCNRNNKRRDVTGMLYYGEGCFLQYLEGQKKDVIVTLQRIKNDHRHSEFSIMMHEETARRIFAEWSMKFISNRYYIDNLFQQVISYGFKSGTLNKRFANIFQSLLKMV